LPFPHNRHDCAFAQILYSSPILIRVRLQANNGLIELWVIADQEGYTMHVLRWLAIPLFVALSSQDLHAFGRSELEQVNCHLHGTIIDHTCNHGVNRRIWSRALCQWRDMYVYLPPGYDPGQCYPVILYLHGYAEDENSLLHLIIPLDRAIAERKMPPVIIAAPDGSIQARPTYIKSASFFANSRAGNFEDYVMQDVWPFLLANYPIRPERDAHVIAGVSMGGGAAYTLAIKYSQVFRHVVGIFPAVNLRWVDCHGNYRANFDPCCWGWRTQVRPCEVLGRFYGVIPVHSWVLMCPVFGFESDSIAKMSAINPIEMLDSYNVYPGQFEMFMAYGGCDEFNIDAHVESFLYRAKQKGLPISSAYDPTGRHNLQTGLRFVPYVVEWAAPRLAPYSPGMQVRPGVPQLIRPVGASRTQ